MCSAGSCMFSAGKINSVSFFFYTVINFIAVWIKSESKMSEKCQVDYISPLNNTLPVFFAHFVAVLKCGALSNTFR